MALFAGAALAGGGGEELPVAPAARPEVVAEKPKALGAEYDCANPGISYAASPRVIEYYHPESRWYFEQWAWKDGGFKWVKVAMDTPNAVCENYWTNFDRNRKESTSDAGMNLDRLARTLR
jgi:hypothetical protein